MLDPIDVARPELFAEDRWQEPFRILREQAPVQFVPDSKFGPYWSVTAYKPIVHVEALPKLFSSSFEKGGITLGARPDMLRGGERRVPQFIAMDPPRHTAQRRTVAPAFGPSEVAAMRDEARELAAAYANVGHDVLERCIETAAGHPLFLVQLLRSAEAGQIADLQRGEGLWQVGRRSFVVRHQATEDECDLFDTSRRMARNTSRLPATRPQRP